MPAVTQQIPNFLGGVSRQTDDKKLINQLTECVNGYPDPTFGLLKRPGMKHTNVLKKADGTAFTKTELEDAAWFFIDRATAGSYIGAIKGQNIYVWTANEGTFCTVTIASSTFSPLNYLNNTSNQNDYHFRSIQDTTFITNKTVPVAALPDDEFEVNSQAAIRLKTLVSGDVVKINITGTKTGTKRTATATAQASATFDTFLTGTHATHDLLGAVKAKIEARQSASDAEFDGKWYLNSYANSITIRRTTEANGVVLDQKPGSSVTYKYFKVTGQGGTNNNSIEISQDSVTNVSELPLESFHDHTLTILNSDTEDDDYYVKFVAADGDGGKGYWEETRARDSSPGFSKFTMPHQLIATGPTTFTFGVIDYEPRLTGDSNTNPNPSFVGKKINSTIFLQ